MLGESRSGSAASRFGTSSSPSRFTAGLRGDASRSRDILPEELATLSWLIASDGCDNELCGTGDKRGFALVRWRIGVVMGMGVSCYRLENSILLVSLRGSRNKHLSLHDPTSIDFEKLIIYLITHLCPFQLK